MSLNSKLHGLYAITNEKLMPENIFLNMAETAVKSGVRILQYRDKSSDNKKRLQQALSLKKICDQYQVTFIINDDIELMKQVDADGVHIGKNDSSLKKTRQQIGKHKIIGVTCYNKIELATEAIEQGADYIAFGSFFNSDIKPNAPCATIDLISAIKQKHNTPVCCIGGITIDNCSPLLHAGADMLAVISDLFAYDNNDDIAHKCGEFERAFSASNR